MQLKPCPFCNSAVKIIPAEEAYADIDNSYGAPEYNGQFVIDHLEQDKQRSGCVWHGSVVIWEPTIEKAALIWNTRGGAPPKVLPCPICGDVVEYTEHYDPEYRMPYYTYSHPRTCPCLKKWESKGRLTLGEKRLLESWSKFCDEIRNERQ